jgi:hypothetical protein
LWQFQETTPEYAQFAQEAVAQFRQQYPQITFETMVDGNGNNEKTLPALVAGLGPDIIKSYPPSVWELAAKGQVLNHSELVKELKRADIEDFHRYQWEGMVIPSTNFRYGRSSSGSGASKSPPPIGGGTSTPPRSSSSPSRMGRNRCGAATSR